MTITRIDCDFLRAAGSEESTSYLAFNPSLRPGTLVAASSVAALNSIGNQVAGKLALEHFVSGVVAAFAEQSDTPQPAVARSSAHGVEFSQLLLEAGFKRSNRSVYDFGHRLAAGGRMAAALWGLVISESAVATGRVGSWSVYLCRQGELFPFFDDRVSGKAAGNSYGSSSGSSSGGSSGGGFVGAQSLVTVETASVPLEADDLIYAFAGHLPLPLVRELALISDNFDFFAPRAAERLCRRLFGIDPWPKFAMLARMGPESVFLNEVVSDMQSKADDDLGSDV